MSASQHQNRLISSIVFDPWFLSTRLLTFEHIPLINVECTAGGWVPDVSLTKGESCDFLDYFLPLWFLSTRLLTFDHFPLINVERHCWLMGPRCQPHYTRNSWYLDYFVPVILQATCLSFSIPSIKQRTRMWAPEVSLWVQEIIDILIIFHPWYSLVLSLPLNFLTP